MVGAPGELFAKLHQGGRRNVGDFMTFELEPDNDRPKIRNDGMQHDGLRFRADCKLAGKIYCQPFGVDLAFGDPILGVPEIVVAQDVLAFAGVAPPSLRLYPIETHIAECAAGRNRARGVRLRRGEVRWSSVFRQPRWRLRRARRVQREPPRDESKPLRKWATRCAGCAAPCIDACTVLVPDAFNHGLTQRKAIYRPTPHGLPDMLVIDAQACNACGDCARACPANAVSLDAQDERSSTRVDAVVLALGSGWSQPEQDALLTPYVASKDVVSALQFERWLTLSDAQGAVLRRPSDGRPVQRIGWIQCAGSRDRKHNRDFCASVCCMFALKEAVRVRANSGGRIQTTVFYMDLRTPGKDYHRYRERAEAQGVRLVRSRVHEVVLSAEGRLRVRHGDARGIVAHEELDMLVLSSAMASREACSKVAGLFGLELTPQGHLPWSGLEPSLTDAPGVFACGALVGPADIATSVVSAGAAASEVSKLMTVLGRAQEPRVSGSPTQSVPTAAPRVAVLLCRCHAGQGLPASALEHLKLCGGGLPGVDAVAIVDTPCLGGRDTALQVLQASKANRVVFAACMPYRHRRALWELADGAGVPSGLVRVVEVRAGAPSAGGDRAHDATVRALRAAAEELRAADVPSGQLVAMAPGALVVGGGLAGMRAALSLADRGVPVDLVERTGSLGGLAARRLVCTLEGADLGATALELRRRVEQCRRICVHLGARVESSTPASGGRESTILTESGQRERVKHGATIVATGGQQAPTSEYGHGVCDRVLTQLEFDEQLASGQLVAGALRTVVMIQCVGSRAEPRGYCSRVCCAGALRQALRLRSESPDSRVLILHRDIMAVGAWERTYSEARRAGVMFVPYDEAHKPTVRMEDGRPVVALHELVLGRELQVQADCLVLATGLVPDDTSADVARVFGLGLNQDGFYREANAKWRPVDSERDGIFLAGAGHCPQPARDVLAQAEACAQRAFALLSRGDVLTPGITAEVHHALCARCEACVTACPYHARHMDAVERRIVVDPMSCRACGGCAVACPSGAARVCGMGDRQLMAMLDAVLADVTVGGCNADGELR